MDSSQDEGIINPPSTKALNNCMHPNVVKILMRSNRIKQLTKLWFTTRTRMITCSDAAAVLGKNPYSNRNAVLKKKTGRSRPFQGNTATRRGQKLEPVALEVYQKKTGKLVWPEDVGLLCHPDWNCIGGSPDGITLDGILIEIKCPLTRPIIPGFVPCHYLPQVLILLEIFDLETAHFVQYSPANTYRHEILDITVVKRDRVFWSKALPVLLDFMEEVTEFYNKVQMPIGTPMIDFSKEDAQARLRLSKDKEDGIGKVYTFVDDTFTITEYKGYNKPADVSSFRVSDDSQFISPMKKVEHIKPDSKISLDLDAIIANYSAQAQKTINEVREKIANEMSDDEDENDNESTGVIQIDVEALRVKMLMSR
jgi:putative phage-type endonuclease